MSQLGLGVILQTLAGNEHAYNLYHSLIGKKIKSFALVKNAPPVSKWMSEADQFQITFEDGSRVAILDEGQSCCESRYMVCDDNLDGWEGATFTGIEQTDGPSTEGEYGEMHEVQFVNVQTDRGRVQLVTHNEHNGYYGGFAVSIIDLNIDRCHYAKA